MERWVRTQKELRPAIAEDSTKNNGIEGRRWPKPANRGVRHVRARKWLSRPKNQAAASVPAACPKKIVVFEQ